MSTSTVQRLHDRQVDVETPEHVAIGYELADLGSRFTALLIDRLILLLAQAGVFLAVYLSWKSAGGSGNLFSGVGLAIAIAAYFVLQWGYFILYEGLRDGQTPGKR
ncbi:MAG TPA: RDD family protein, partial [Longimicrobium sp.]